MILGLKLNFKLVYLEEISFQNLNFINKRYYIEKNAILIEKKEILNKLKKSSDKLRKLKEKLFMLENEFKISKDMDKINDCEVLNLKVICSDNGMDDNLKLMLYDKDIIEKQIFFLKSKLNDKLQYNENKNSDIDHLKRQSENISNLKINELIEKEIYIKKNRITEKQKKIQEFIKNSNKLSSNFLLNYIDKIYDVYFF